MPLNEQEEIDKLSDESYAIYSGALEEINVRRAIKKRIMLEAKEKLNSTPQDKDGNYCVEITALPSETVISYVCAIRESLISVMEEESQNRRKVTDDLCEERKEVRQGPKRRNDYKADNGEREKTRQH